MTAAFGVGQTGYRFYSDGTEAGAVELGTGEDTAYTIMAITDQNIHVRIQISEVGTGTVSGATTDDYQLQRSINGAAFANVTTTSTGAKVNTASALTDGNNTTQRLISGGGSFVAGRQDDANGIADNMQLTANNFSEHVFGITVVAADLAHNDVVTFQLLYNGALFTTTSNGAYTLVPTLTISKSLNFTGEPTTAALTTTGQAPTVAASSLLEPTTAAVAITGQAPTFSAGFTADPAVVALALTGLAPTFSGGLSERLTPNTILATTNLKDSASNIPPTLLTDIDEETGSGDGLWWTAVNPEADILARVGFPTSSGNLVGTQTIRVLIRGTSLPSRNWKLRLFESGSPVAPEVSSTGSVSSISGQVVQLTFQPNVLADQTGANAEIEISATAA